MISVVVMMVTVAQHLNIVHLMKDVNQSLVSVQKEDVVRYMVHVRMVNVVVKKDIVVQLLDIVLFLKDVKRNMVNVQ